MSEIGIVFFFALLLFKGVYVRLALYVLFYIGHDAVV